METNYDVNYFIRKFEAIPEIFWLANGQLHDGDKHCAYGHCATDGAQSGDGLALYELFKSEFGEDGYVAEINDGGYLRYRQPTPKQRILAALYDIKKSQQPTYPDLTKQIANLPIQEEVSDKIKTDVYANIS